MKPAMDFIEIIERSAKPRKTGLTLVTDAGFGQQMLRGYLETTAPFIDYAKIRNVSPRLYPESMLLDKVALYGEYGVDVFFGGILFEMAYVQGKLDQAIGYAAKVGVKTAEISENIISLSVEKKLGFVQRYRDAGLRVFYEWGKKYPTEPLDLRTAVDEIRQVLAHGAFKVILEQSELTVLFKSEGGSSVLKELIAAVGAEHIVFETPNTEEQMWLINELGPDVNLGPNIALEGVLWLEPMRRGLGRASGYTAFNKYLQPQRQFVKP